MVDERVEDPRNVYFIPQLYTLLGSLSRRRFSGDIIIDCLYVYCLGICVLMLSCFFPEVT
jgi:hypothetical protein